MKIRHALALVAFATGCVAADPQSEVEHERAREANYRAFASAISALTTRLESFIVDDVVKKTGASEFPPARRYALHDIDGDKKGDLFLITTFEPLAGGNNHESHLFAVLTSRPNEVQHLVVGGRGSRGADRFVHSHNSLHLFLRFQVWAQTDAECCPSLSTTEEICLQQGNIVLRPFDETRRKG